ncbi:MAG: hypothetical protein GC205_08905 [Bacteroidetes bacterium]|nr:hypothetical protein [Bacteroidota bacterium]
MLSNIIYGSSAGCLLAAFFYLLKWLKERRMLINIINEIKGDKSQFASIESLTVLKKYLSKNINYDTAKREAKRPLLRQPAATTLKTGFGFCGENARVAVLMLNYGGIKAGRVYLFGNRWNHVVVEHLYNDKWYLFDAHNDPGVMLPDAKVAKILIEDISSFPNEYRDQNEWVASCRIKIARKVSMLSGVSQWRLPKPFTILVESPDLIMAIAFLMAGIALLILKQIMI